MKKLILPLIIMFACTSLHAGKFKVLLKLDYTARPEWSYTLDYHSECVITDTDSISRIRTRVLCGITAKPLAPKMDRMSFTINSANVDSKLFTPEQQNNIISKLTGSTFGLALIGGCPVVDTLSSFTVGELSEWDLVLQFAKLLPFMPRKPVRKGYSWDENGVFMVRTSLGDIPCEVYRLYTIDSLAGTGNTAYISWKFRYAAAKLAMDSASILKKVPVSGNGKGTAEIDALNHVLMQANVEFQTPIATYGTTRINWIEKTILRYLPGGKQ